MSHAVKLSDELVHDAKIKAKAMHRSTARQIEYWSKIGKISEENPDLTYSMIKEILISLEEVNAGETEPYEFD